MSYNTATPYIAIYLLLKKDGQIAFILRSKTDWMNNHYGLVQGKVEKNESYSTAAVREAKEEADVDIKPADLNHVHTVHRYEPSSQAKDWVDVYFEITKWMGEPHNNEPHKHSELSWFDINNTPNNLIPCVKFALEQIQAGKTYSEYGWDSIKGPKI